MGPSLEQGLRRCDHVKMYLGLIASRCEGTKLCWLSRLLCGATDVKQRHKDKNMSVTGEHALTLDTTESSLLKHATFHAQLVGPGRFHHAAAHPRSDTATR